MNYSQYVLKVFLMLLFLNTSLLSQSAPVFNSAAPEAVTQNTAYRYVVRVSDDDQDALTVSGNLVPEWLSLDLVWEFREQPVENNPLPFQMGTTQVTSFVDIDADGDMDVFIAEYNPLLNYFENIGSSESPEFIERTGTENPFNSVDVWWRAVPVFVDIDSDGDMDAFANDSDGTVSYYKNVGTHQNAILQKFTETGNPLSMVSFDLRALPGFADIDEDGDQDVFIIDGNSNIHFFENVGSRWSPVFVEQMDDLNLFGGGLASHSAPRFSDFDSDGDMDAFIGDDRGNILCYENVGPSSSPSFQLLSNSNSPLWNILNDISSFIPSFVDIDGDGDQDLFAGEYFDILFYRNESQAVLRGTPLNGDLGSHDVVLSVDDGFNEVTQSFTISVEETTIPFADNNSYRTLTNTPVDITLTAIDVDGDALSYELETTPQNGELSGTPPDLTYSPAAGWTGVDQFNFYVDDGMLNSDPATIMIEVHSNQAPSIDSTPNIQVAEDIHYHYDVSVSDPDGDFLTTEGILLPDWLSPEFETTFSLAGGTQNPFNGIPASYGMKMHLVDFDCDGDLDALLSEQDNGSLRYCENIGSSDSFVFQELEAEENPVNMIETGIYDTPSAVDLDSDGDMDLFIGARDGRTYYYENVGDCSTPLFVERFGLENPLNMDLGERATPRFVDIDNDHDFDAFVGCWDGTIHFFENEGNRINPIFIEKTGDQNPLNIDVGQISGPSFVDMDHDGDWDMFSGERYGNVSYYKNTGTITSPIFIEQSGANNPLNALDVDSGVLEFIDVDQDGDIDFFDPGLRLYLDVSRTFFEGTPSDDNLGENSVQISVSDGVEEALQTFTITVIDTISPTAASYTTTTAENTPAATPLLGLDGDGDSLSYEVLTFPLFGALSGDIPDLIYTPGIDWMGTDEFTYQASDQSSSSSVGLITIIVTSNIPPVFQTTIPDPAYEDIDYDFVIDAGDLDGDSLTFSASGLPDWLTISDYSALDLQVVENNPFLTYSTSKARLEFVDLDNDGDKDAVIGNIAGTVSFYKNLSVGGGLLFEEQTGALNPFGGILDEWRATPALGDLDNDGDLDLLLGSSSDFLSYFKNTGSSTQAVFVEQNGADNPIGGVAFNDCFPALVDIDSDGLLDLFVGEAWGIPRYFHNEGTLSAPVFVEKTGGANPSQSMTSDSRPIVEFVDIDRDLDMDVFVGTRYGDIRFYKNNGTVAEPDFDLQTGNNNPFTGIDFGYDPGPAFTDIDGDGDMDAFIGHEVESISFYKNVRGAHLAGTALNEHVGFHEFNLSVSDGVHQVSQDFSLEVINTNDPPTARNVLWETYEDQGGYIPFDGIDPDQDDLSYNVVTPPRFGSISEGQYIPLQDWSGVDDLTYTTTDSLEESSPAVVTIVVYPVNDPPEAFNLHPVDDLVVTPDNFDSDSLVFMWETSNDVDGDTLVYRLQASIFISGFTDTVVAVIDTTISDTECMLMSFDMLSSMIFESSAVTASIEWNVVVDDSEVSVLSENGPLFMGVDLTPLSLDQLALPENYTLGQNFPNPFNPLTSVRFGLPQRSEVNLVIYDINGRKVMTLISESKSAGWYQVDWDGSNQSGNLVPSGVYMTRIEAGDFTDVIKMIYLK